MRVGQPIVTVVFGVICASAASGCSCSNTTPIERNHPSYSERAVFIARTVQLTGKVYNINVKRVSSRAAEVIRHGYWGLPWYWPGVVVLDGSYPCDMGMSEGEEYLVSGRRIRYGVLAVNVCSRTQPLSTTVLPVT